MLFVGRVLLSVAVSLCTLATLAQAADIPVYKAPAKLAVAPAAEPLPSWYVRLGLLAAFPDTSASFTLGGAPFVGGDATSNDNYTLGFDVGYFFTPNIAISLAAGIPPTLKLYGAGTIEPALAAAGLDNYLGSVLWGPAMLTGHYHFTNFGPFQPYIGAGVAYAIIFKNNDNTLVDLDVKNNFGFVLQGGFDYMLTRNWGLFLDVKYVWLETDATANVITSPASIAAGLAGLPVTAHVKLDPWVVFTGITYRF